MANADRPRGWRPVKLESGAPWNSVVRTIGPVDGTDVFLFDHLKLSSGRATSATADTDVVLGVAVGFGRLPAGNHGAVGSFDPTNLENRFYDDSEETHTQWTIYFVPARGSLFLGQTDGSESAALLLGTSYDITYTTGSTTTGVSAFEIKGGTTAGAGEGLTIIENVNAPDNDLTAGNQDNADYIFKFASVV